MAEEPGRLIQLDEEIEGDRRGTADFAFRRIGESVPLKPSGSSFDLENPPSQPLAVSERFRVLFLAHSEGFLVAKTKDVIGIAKEIKEKGKGPCIQGSCVADVRIGRVSILALSADSLTLTATVGGDIHLFSVPSLINKEQEPSFSCSIEEAGIVKDFKWQKNVEKSFVVLSSHSSLYHGHLDGDQPKDVMNNVDAVDWSMGGDFIAVAKKNTLSILSSGFKEQCHMSLLFKTWPNDTDLGCTIKVDSINWVCDDSIIVGCVRVDEDGNEDGYLVQVITSRENGFTKSSCIPVMYSFPDLFGGIAEGILPVGGGPYLLSSYLDRWELVLASNKKAADDHFLLLGWSRDNNKKEVVSLDFQNDMFPRIDLQENGDDNFIMGLGVDKISLYEKVTLQVGSNIEERSPYCILMCLTCEGKLIMFHSVRISEHLDLPQISVLPDDYNYMQEKTSSVISLETGLRTTTSGLKDDAKGGIPDVKSNQVIAGAPYTGKEFRNLDAFKVRGGNIPSGKKEQDSGGYPGQVYNIDQLPMGAPHIQGSNSTLLNSSQTSIHEMNLSSPGKDALSLASMSSEISTASQASTNRIISAEVGKGLVGSTDTARAPSGSQSTGKFFTGVGASTKSSTLSSSTSILSGAQEKTDVGKAYRLPFSPHKSSSADNLSGGKPFSIKDSIREPSSLMVSKAPLNAGNATSWGRTGLAQSVPSIHGPNILTHEGSSPGKAHFSSTQSLLDYIRTSKSPQVLDSEPEISEQFYNVKDMVKELDILLSSIEQEGGFKDACTVVHKSSLLALEEGLENIIEVSRRCKNNVEEQLNEIQHLQNKMLQVSARQVYTEGIVKQASNDKYWDIWDRQKLSPEFDLKRHNILNTNQNLTNQLIELERHFNTLEINRFGETGRVPTSRRVSHSSLDPSRHVQSLHSVYNTLNSQLAAAQQLSECLSNQMAMLNLDKPSVKRLNVAKELFESIGLTHGASAFPSPDVKKYGLTLDSIERVSPSTSKAIMEYPRRNASSALKSAEPETARRSRLSLDRSLAGFEPQKTTVKRMLQEGPSRAIEDEPFWISKGSFDSKMDGLAIAKPKSNETSSFSSQSFLNKFQSDAYRGIQEKSSNQAFEPPSNSVFKWAKDPSGSSHSLASKSYPVQVLHGNINRPSSSSSSMVPSPSLLSSGHGSENSSIPEIPSTGATRLDLQSPEKSSTISRKVSDLQFETSTRSQTFSRVSSNVSPMKTTLTANVQANEQLKQLPVSPQSPHAPSDESNVLSLSSKHDVPSAIQNGITTQVGGIESKNQSSEVSISTASLLTPSASTTSSIISTPVAPSPPPTFPALAFGGTVLNKKPIGETYQAASVLPSSSAASSQAILSSSILSSFPSQKNSPTSTSSALPSESAVSKSLSSNLIDGGSTNESTTAQAPPSEGSLRTSEANSKLETATSQGLANEALVELASKKEPALLSSNTGSMFTPTSDSPPVMPSVMTPTLTAATVGNDELVDTNSSEEDEMEEEAPDTTNVLNLGALGGFGLGSAPPSSGPTPNPFGGSFGTATTNSPSSLLSYTASPGELFRPPSFSLPSAQPVQQPQPVSSSGSAGGFSGFGQPAQIGAGQQALGSVLGSFGQSRQLGAGVQGFGLAAPGGFSGGGFPAPANSGGVVAGGGFAGAAHGGGFTSVATGGGGFVGAAKGGGFGGLASSGGGFAGPAGGGGFAASASGTSGFGGAASAGGGFGGAGQGGGFAAGGFGAFGSNQGGGFSAFGSNSAMGGGRPPAELLTQMRK